MAAIKFEWQLEVTKSGEIFIHHLSAPRFSVQLIIEGSEPNIQVVFKAKWKDRPQGGFDWYFKALEFYNSSIAKMPRW